MKRFLFTALFVLISSLAFAQERIAVFPFEDRDNLYTINQLDLYYREFSSEFKNKTDESRFTVISRVDIEKIIDMEHKFQLAKYSSKEITAEMERVLNPKQILYILILKIDNNNIRINVSRHSFPEMEVLRGGTGVTITNKNQILDKIPELVQAIVTAMGGGTAPAQTPITPNFVRVEGGTFQMGSPSGGYDNERPVHTVTVKSFSIGKYEVTQKEWYEVIGTTIRHQRDLEDAQIWPMSLYGEGDNYPMYYVSWYEAIEYCNRRSIKEGLTPAYRGSGNNITCDWNANGYRLPTEAEWEFAAKGGTKDYLTTEYSGSNNVDAVAWYAGNSNADTHPVGTKAPNSLGIHDMSGNVDEWCWDLYIDYSSEAQIDPRGGISGNYRIKRGGSCLDVALLVRSTFRDYYPPGGRQILLGSGDRDSHFGFRVVRNAN